MAEVSDILKIGKDKYLENNLEQKCGNPFTEWIPYDIIHFRCYVENGIKKYEIYGEVIYNSLKMLYIRPWRYLISQEDGEFAIKYGIESYFIWRNFWVSNYLEYQGSDYRIHHDSNYDCSNYDDRIKECDDDIAEFWKDFNKDLNREFKKLEEKHRNNEDMFFYTEVRLMEQNCSWKKKKKETKKKEKRNLKPKDKKPKHVKRNLDSTKGTSIHLILLYPFVHLTIFI